MAKLVPSLLTFTVPKGWMICQPTPAQPLAATHSATPSLKVNCSGTSRESTFGNTGSAVVREMSHCGVQVGAGGEMNVPSARSPPPAFFLPAPCSFTATGISGAGEFAKISYIGQAKSRVRLQAMPMSRQPDKRKESCHTLWVNPLKSEPVLGPLPEIQGLTTLAAGAENTCHTARFTEPAAMVRKGVFRDQQRRIERAQHRYRRDLIPHAMKTEEEDEMFGRRWFA